MFILLGAITFSGIFFRFYQLDSRLYFQLDEERDWHMIRRAVVFHRPPLVGSYLPPGFYLGPIWFYVSALIAIVTKLDPFKFGIAASSLASLTVPLVFVVGIRLFRSRPVALIATIIYATSYLITIYNRIWWPLVFSPLTTLLVYLSLFKIQRGSLRWSWIMFGMLTLALHGEPPNLTTLILVFVSFFVFRLPWKNRHFLGGAAVLLLSHFPIAIFEMKHDLVITNSIKQIISSLASSSISQKPFLSVVSQVIMAISRVIYPSGFLDTTHQIGWCIEYLRERASDIPLLLIGLSSILIVFMGIKAFQHVRPPTFGQRLISLHLIILVASLFAFAYLSGTPIYEWFFYHTFPTFAFLWALFIVKLLKNYRLLLFSVVGSIIIINVHANLVAVNSHGLWFRKQAVDYALSIIPHDATFSINSLGHCLAWSGYRTLFILNGRIPTSSYLDGLFGSWLYPQELHLGAVSDWTVTFIDHEPYVSDKVFLEQYSKAKEQMYSGTRFGAIEVLVGKFSQGTL